jgi:magnesium-protoporphyrin O-methyltransferase
MPGCCPPSSYDEVFDERFAARIARRYERRGLGRAERRVVDFVEQQGVAGASVLEIGGGVGELQVELLRRGAATAVNLELASSYEREAARLLSRHGLTDRVERRLLDLVAEPDAVPPADVVVLHRVVCCYDDYARLLAAAASHTRRTLVFSHPPRNWLSRAFVGVTNLMMRASGRSYRAFAHPPRAMLAALAAEGLQPVASSRGPVWHVKALTR